MTGDVQENDRAILIIDVYFTVNNPRKYSPSFPWNAVMILAAQTPKA